MGWRSPSTPTSSRPAAIRWTLIPVEYTYGLERIVMYLQGVKEVWQIDWDGRRTYGDVLKLPEIEHCKYDFEVADVTRLKQMYDLFEAEAKNCLAHKLVIPAHDYVLRCSHTFNLLDARGAIGVTERALSSLRCATWRDRCPSLMWNSGNTRSIRGWGSGIRD